MKIYTKTGDNGTTGLFAGPRVRKDHPRIVAYGSVDELNALLGTILAELTPQGSRSNSQMPTFLEFLASVQADLFSIGAELATPKPSDHGMVLLCASRISALEEQIDIHEADLPPLKTFVLPGGSRGSAMLHLARTVCRRAERDVVQLSHEPSVANCDRVVAYLNRLSDLLFVLARLHNHQHLVSETPWVPPPPIE